MAVHATAADLKKHAINADVPAGSTCHTSVHCLQAIAESPQQRQACTKLR
jgi:hypothetical protein